MTKYQELIQKKEEALEKAREFKQKGDDFLSRFWLNVADDCAERARSIPVEEAAEK